MKLISSSMCLNISTCFNCFKFVLLLRVNAAIEKRKKVVFKGLACSISPQIIWPILVAHQVTTKSIKTQIFQCMFTKKLVSKMLLFTVLLMNLAFGAGKWRTSQIILFRYLNVYFPQKQNMLRTTDIKKIETKIKRISDTRSTQTRSFHLLFLFSGKIS